MPRQEDFTFLSADGKTQIHAVKWIPDSGEYDQILQITHGMIEYIERYAPFAEFLCTKGFLVVGHDHLGHGQSVRTQEDRGYFAENRPSTVLVSDMHRLRTMIQKENKGIPYFMMAHSMGSYMLRKYLTVHNDNLCGAIIMGTGFMPESRTRLAIGTVKMLAKLHGWRYRSRFVTNATFGKSYKKFDLDGKNPENSWLSKNVENVKEYYLDPRCTFMFTLNGYMGLFEAVLTACNKDCAARIPKELPLFLVSGADDPVGDAGIGVKKAYYMYKEAGLLDLTYKLYKNDRHEILNEPDHQKVYNDLLAWMKVRIEI